MGAQDPSRVSNGRVKLSESVSVVADDSGGHCGERTERAARDAAGCAARRRGDPRAPPPSGHVQSPRGLLAGGAVDF